MHLRMHLQYRNPYLRLGGLAHRQIVVLKLFRTFGKCFALQLPFFFICYRQLSQPETLPVLKMEAI